MKTYWGVALEGRFTAGETALGTHWIGGWVSPRAGLDEVEKRKIPSPRRESKLRTPIVQPVASRCTDWAIPALSQSLPWYLHAHKTELWKKIVGIYICKNME
jgi:hypothetical protein